jgi:hypothetical protein
MWPSHEGLKYVSEEAQRSYQEISRDLPRVIARSAGGGEIGCGFGVIVLISCFSFAKSFFTSGPQAESSAFRPATSH